MINSHSKVAISMLHFELEYEQLPEEPSTRADSQSFKRTAAGDTSEILVKNPPVIVNSHGAPVSAVVKIRVLLVYPEFWLSSSILNSE